MKERCIMAREVRAQSREWPPGLEAFLMSTIRIGASSWLIAAVLAGVLLAAPPARAQVAGYGFGYGYPGYGFGYGYPGNGFNYGYGYPGFGYGFPAIGYGFGYGIPAYGFGYGYPGFGYGYVGVGGFPPVIPYGGFLGYSAYANPMVGVGLTPLGNQSYFIESNMLGRAQYSADQRARARELLRHGR
jgi:hypothetical protein